MTALLVEGERAAAPAAEALSIRGDARRRQELVGLLAEGSAIYQGLGTQQAERLRGFILSSFEHVGLPADAAPFVVEELATGFDPYVLAAAARALRGAREISEGVTKSLARAVNRVIASDDFVQFDTWPPNDPLAAKTLASVDVLRSVALLGARAASLMPMLSQIARGSGGFSAETAGAIKAALAAVSSMHSGESCCNANDDRAAEASARIPLADLSDLALQDQDGRGLSFGAFFIGRPSVVTFFYTRCMNPEKCSLTITKLARLQKLLKSQGLENAINLAAITYDPAFDLPERLHAYGAGRGFLFSERAKLIRTQGPLQPLQDHLDLGVGFGPSTVNRHRIELFLMDARCELRAWFVRVPWNEEAVMPRLLSMISED